MNKKILFVFAIILVVSFSAGVFTQIISPSGTLKISAQLPGLADSIFDYIKSDIATIAAAVLFSASVFLMPAVVAMVIGKTFSMGFSAAYILSSFEEKGMQVIISALFPRALFKIPAYIALIFISYQTAKFIKANYRNPRALKNGTTYLIQYFLCFLTLTVSSILEAVLLQGVL